MHFYNYDYEELKKACEERPVFVFGLGHMFWNKYFIELPHEIWRNVKYFVDNGCSGTDVELLEKKLTVESPLKLKEEDNGIILIASSDHMKEIYEQLESFDLSDNLICVALPFVRREKSIPSSEEHDTVTKKRPQIPKIIHTFWFSGEQKPDAYQKCLESWKQYCGDYEIKIWDANDYDVEKHPFMYDAFKEKKWAFVSDYARLDVIYEQGGVYLDLDVELLKNIDPLLGNHGFFSFNHRQKIDLAVFASVPRNPIFHEMMKLYDGLEFYSYKEYLAKVCQPDLLSVLFEKKGVLMDGSMQNIGDDVILPRTYFMPMDPSTGTMDEETGYTFGIHLCNGGWIDQEELQNYRQLMGDMWNRLEKSN